MDFFPISPFWDVVNFSICSSNVSSVQKTFCLLLAWLFSLLHLFLFLHLKLLLFAYQISCIFPSDSFPPWFVIFLYFFFCFEIFLFIHLCQFLNVVIFSFISYTGFFLILNYFLRPKGFPSMVLLPFISFMLSSDSF